MKKTRLFTLFILLFILSVDFCSAQKDYWTVQFPGYEPSCERETLSLDQELNLALNNSTTGQGMFASLDKSGFLTFQQNTSEIALLHCKDSSGNRYLVSYNMPVLHIQKYNAQNTLVWDNPLSLTNGVDPQFLVLSYFVRSTQFLFTANGTLAIAGPFKTDSAGFGYQTLNVFFIDTATGNLTAEYYEENVSFISLFDINMGLDNSGNINLIYSQKLTSGGFVRKITPNGTVLSQHIIGEPYTSIGGLVFLKFTDDYIYVLSETDTGTVYLLIMGKDLLDTLFCQYIYTDMTYNFSMFDFFDADNSGFYLLHDMDGFGTYSYTQYDANGSIVCVDSSGNFAFYGDRFFRAWNKSCVIYQQLKTVDASCSISPASPVFDYATQLLFFTGSINYNTEYTFVAPDVVYLGGANSANSSFAVIGIRDAVPDNFSGKLYFDINNNCTPDTLEPGFPNQLVKIDPAGSYIFTDSLGNFRNRLDTGSYVLSAVPLNNTLVFCPASISLNVTDTTTFYAGNNIAVQDQAGNLQDLAITINQSGCMPGFYTYIFLTVTNKEPLPASGYVKLTMQPGLFSFQYATSSPDSLSGNDYYWHVSNLGFYAQSHFYIEFRVDSAAPLGATFTNSAQVVNFSGESYLANNTDVFTSTIVGSFDPNDKAVIPRGIGANGVISPADTILNYKIQFQNTGTYQAYTIKVVDTIDVSTLDISTFKLLSTSHPCVVSITDDKVITFLFNNINLPDSNTNEMLSHGFINYSIQTYHNLPLLTQIKNKACIYFDYNQPVITNETINTIDAVGFNETNFDSKIYLYPNPVKDQLTVVCNKKAGIIKLAVYDLQGREIKDITMTLVTGKAILPVTDLSKGYYFLKAETGTTVLTKPFIKL